MWDAYSASKAARNMQIRGFASHHACTNRASVIMTPGWACTDMGGPDADLDIDESIPGVVDTLGVQVGSPDLRFCRLNVPHLRLVSS